jgi:hypothetical protein
MSLAHHGVQELPSTALLISVYSAEQPPTAAGDFPADDVNQIHE